MGTQQSRGGLLPLTFLPWLLLRRLVLSLLETAHRLVLFQCFIFVHGKFFFFSSSLLHGFHLFGRNQFGSLYFSQALKYTRDFQSKPFVIALY